MAVAILAQVNHFYFRFVSFLVARLLVIAAAEHFKDFQPSTKPDSLSSVPRAFYEARQLGSTIRYQPFYFLFMTGEGTQKHSSFGLFPTSPTIFNSMCCVFGLVQVQNTSKHFVSKQSLLCFKIFVISCLPDSK